MLSCLTALIPPVQCCQYRAHAHAHSLRYSVARAPSPDSQRLTIDRPLSPWPLTSRVSRDRAPMPTATPSLHNLRQAKKGPGRTLPHRTAMLLSCRHRRKMHYLFVFQHLSVAQNLADAPHRLNSTSSRWVSDSAGCGYRVVTLTTRIKRAHSRARRSTDIT
jgi:hypothetical protein